MQEKKWIKLVRELVFKPSLGFVLNPFFLKINPFRIHPQTWAEVNKKEIETLHGENYLNYY